MRDPDRIDDVLDELEQYWKEHPDMRLAQIVCNAYQHTAWIPSQGVSDPYEMEDDALLHYLRKQNE